MSGRDYSTLTSNTGAGSVATGSARKPWWRRGPVLGAVAAVVVLVVIIWAIVSALGGDSGSSQSTQAGPAIRSAHGPTSITRGVPSGYTHDKAGAATAGANFITAVDEARLGRVTADAVKSQLVVSQPTQALTKVLDEDTDRQEAESAGEVSNDVPVVTSVTSYSPDRAVVSVWSVGASQMKVSDAGKVGVNTLWATTTVTLQWIDNDWKASDWSFQLGPNPDQAMFPDGDSPLRVAGVGGMYTFFVE